MCETPDMSSIRSVGDTELSTKNVTLGRKVKDEEDICGMEWIGSEQAIEEEEQSKILVSYNE
jgi:hypothetical protein